MKKTYTVFIDCGDTLADEESQVFIEGELVKSADLIPGAKELILMLKERGFTVALVADGLTLSFRNILNQHGLWDCFDYHAISEEVGICKPHEAMFRNAADALGIKDEDFSKVVMVGNNLSRDVKGANALGMKSVFLSWSPRYPKVPADKREKPDYTIAMPLDLLDLMEKLEKEAVS